ncbi:sulfatase family protein [Arthrobacter castelli]|uniref:sulfatase family protein n=1 Tax=Arthrobacter castelli TaxID=271431 RepID=UPI0003F7D6F3|nr:sulfatase [Arthrobacter castelli]
MSRRAPNVLFVLADEWRAQACGYAGDTNASTPAIDRLASESINFEEAISGHPICAPARASLLTGQYPLTHGVYINDVPLEPAGPTVGEVFQDAGYQTGYIGKWHLYGSPDGHYGRREEYIPPEYRFGFQYWKVGECTHDYNRSFYYEGNNPTKKYWNGYDAEAQTEDACRFMRDSAYSKRPFFLVLSYGPPHFPLDTAPAQHRRKYSEREINLRPNVPQENAHEAAKDLRGYYSHISALDDCLDRLLSAIDASGIREETVVVFTSDHGDMMGSQGMHSEQKLYPWEESVRVPLLMRHPPRLRPGRSPDLINTPDIMPTLLGLCGLPIPESVQGENYFRESSRTDLPKSSAFVSMPVPVTKALSHGIAEYRGVRNGKYTYVRSIQGPWLLYDNENDPYQMHNLCGRPETQNVQQRLETELVSWLEKLGDDFLKASEYLARDSLTHYAECNTPVGYVRSPWDDWESTLPPTS